MSALLRLVRLLLRGEGRALARGLALSILVLAMGVALLSLSGWFILATAAAGLAGLGILFNVFVPSALVRLLALGRTAARYGERVLTHDATLRALSALRVQLLQGLLRWPYRGLEALRANTFLNRVTADVDAMDGALLRLVLPALAGGLVIAVTGTALWWLVHPSVALVVGLGYLVLPSAIFVLGQRLARPSARRAEAAMQAGRTRLIDLIAGRDDLLVFGQIGTVSDGVRAAFARHSTARARLDRVERGTGAALDLVGAGLVALAFALGASLVQGGEISAARAAIGVFAALALAETVAPVRRALTETGRMVQAAGRVLPLVAAQPEASGDHAQTGPVALQFDTVSYRTGARSRPLITGLSFQVVPGQTVALTGPSGSGKSTVLLLAAGALEPQGGTVRIGDRLIAEWSDAGMRHSVALVPQRHALIGGTVAENLRLAAPEADDATLWEVLGTVRLADTIRARGGLSLQLGFRGAGLSGGEGRRLALARALLRDPAILLLDEPTEGLDDAMARAVMQGVRDRLPRAAILLAAHRPAEIDAADCVITMHWPDRGSAPS